MSKEPGPTENGPDGHDPEGSRWDDLLENRSGDLEEFEEALPGELADPNDPGDLVVPPGVVRRLLADPVHAPELLVARAVEHHAGRAAQHVRLLKERNADATDRQLAVHFKRKYRRLSRWEGASTGTVGIFGLPVDLAALAWIQHRLVLSIAAAYGHDMDDHLSRGAELLMIQGLHNSTDVARTALIKQAQSAAEKLIMRHLRKQALTLTKQLFRSVGIKFTRKALLEKGVPLVAIPLSAGVNEASTGLLAVKAIKYYDTRIV